ncbi:MAG: hypothetical protein K1X36_12985 [Pyrinomonadaceae bacterium]|nr:hypothetical protein [Pyrinomonadaceae bacterium]
MSRTKFNLTMINVLRSVIILAVLASISGCRELSVFFDPGKGATKKQLKVVKRDKPNLESDPGERPVDPDSADLVEATEEEAVEDGALAQKTASAADVESGDENALIAEIEKKARAIAGRWETAGTDDFIAIEFSEPNAEGDTFVGTYTFFVNDTQDEPAKYVVSREDIIKLFANGGENKTIKITVSADGKSVTYSNNKGISSKMVRAGSRPIQKPAPAPRQEVPKDDLPQQKEPPRIERPDQ